MHAARPAAATRARPIVEAARRAGWEVVEAHEVASSPAGAAAVINRAVRASSGPAIVAIEDGWDADWTQVERLAEQAERAAGIVCAHADASPEARPGEATPNATRAGKDAWRRDLHGWLRAAAHDTLEGLTAGLAAERPWAFAMPRGVFDGLGGLDERRWSVGELHDLERRARAAGIGVDVVEVPARPPSSPAWPLGPHVARALAIRHLALDALEGPPDQRGPRLTALSVMAWCEAWRAAALDATRFTFGGDWGRVRWADRLTGRSGATPGDSVWPLRAEDALLPLVALDSVLDVLVTPASGGAATALASRAFRPARREAHPKPPEARESATAARTPPRVSVIVVNWNGREHLTPCFASLEASDYPRDRLELICIDNGSTDGSGEFLASTFPGVTLVPLAGNLGFTGGNEAGVARARGDVLVFLNNDMRVEPDVIRHLVAALDEGCACVAARVLSWDGGSIDFVRGTVNFEARGFQEHYGKPNRPELAASETFFPNGGAFAITREAYERAGGFDPAFFAYYDDVDLGWGVRLAGLQTRVASQAVVYHRHGATSRQHPAGHKRFLMERNAIWTMVKRYGDDTLPQVLGAALALAARRVVQDAQIDPDAAWSRGLAPFSARCRRRRAPAAARLDEVYFDAPCQAPAVRRVPADQLAGPGAALADLDRVLEQRRRLQALRAVPDAAVLPQFGSPFAATSVYSSYLAAQEALADRLGLPALFGGRTRLLLVTHEPIRANMAGPGVRVLELARALSARCAVTIATPYEPGIEDQRVVLAQYSFDRATTLRDLAGEADVIVVQGFTLARFPFLAAVHTPIVVDLYCPFTVEHLEMRTSGGLPEALPALAALERDAAGVLRVQNEQLQLGDFFLCASERQRDFWIGALHTAGRVNPRTYAADPTLRTLIDVVPFGVPDEALVPDRTGADPVLKGARPGIAAGDRVLLWGGSILDWQDPQTLIRAVAELARGRSDVKLFFMGTRHPTPDVPAMRAVDECLELARALGVLDSHVFFHDWVPYGERGRYLREADLGLSTHREHLETRLSFRTRVLDYIWAGLPIVCTEGDFFAGLVRERGLGLVVPPGDVPALSGAIAELLDNEVLRASCREGLAALSEELRWSRVVAPLARFCAAPRFAPDRELAVGAYRRHLAKSFRVTRWAKRTALGLGVSEGRIEQVKAWGVVRAGMGLRNRVAMARAARRAAKAKA